MTLRSSFSLPISASIALLLHVVSPESPAITYDDQWADYFAAMIERRRSRSDRVKELNNLIKHYPFAAKAERGIVKGFWRVKTLTPSVCQVTFN